MRKTLRPACLLCAAVYAIAAHAPCPPGVAAGDSASGEHAAHTETADGRDPHADCHAAGPEVLEAPCPCGCGDRPAAAPGAARLGCVLLAALTTSPPAPDTARVPAPEAPTPPAAPVFELDPVPI